MDAAGVHYFCGRKGVERAKADSERHVALTGISRRGPSSERPPDDNWVTTATHDNFLMR